MNAANDPKDASAAQWLTHDHRTRMPATSMLAGSEKAPPATVASLNRVVDAAHGVVDRFADSAAPKLRQLGESVARAEAALHAQADQLGRTRDEWAEGLRSQVRGHPLAAVAAALAVGALIARVTG